jgi:hypothetical protein
VRKGEPGESYVTALRRWPIEVAKIRNKDLATKIGLSAGTVSDLLQNSRGWKTTNPTLLERALKIINACGGAPEDLEAWIKYHDRVVAYQAAIRKPPLPTPPEPTPLAAPRPASDVALAIADPTGDRPARPRRRWALRVTIWAVVFGLLAWRLGYDPDRSAWVVLIAAAFAVLLPMACLVVATLLMALVGPQLDTITRRDQERPFVTNAKDRWPLYAMYLLVLGICWAATPLFDVTWLSTEIKVLITGAVLILFARAVQLQVRQVSYHDTAWPPTVTPDTLTFRRAATRLHEKLTTDQSWPRNQADREQAESVLRALADVRTELADRAHLPLRRWLTEGPTKDPLPAVAMGTLASVVVLDCAGITIRLWQGATVTSVLPALAVLGSAVALATIALTVSFHTQRRHDRRLAEELHEWDEKLRPLVVIEEDLVRGQRHRHSPADASPES